MSHPHLALPHLPTTYPISNVWQAIYAPKLANLNALKPTPLSLSPVSTQETLIHALDIPYPFQVVRQSSKGEKSDVQLLSPVEALNTLQRARTVALGDLHASVRKLMETLITAGFIRLPPEDLQRFTQAASQMEEASQALEHFSQSATKHPINRETALQILKKSHEAIVALLPKVEWIDGKRQLILIGDVLSDRGPLDLTTLSLIEHLTKEDPNRLIRLASNHDHNTLDYIVNDESSASPTPSLHHAILLARRSPEGEEALKKRYLNYLRQSSLLHWDPESQTLYSHAPITQQCLNKAVDRLIASGLKVQDYETVTKQSLPGFINALNHAYRLHVEEMADTLPEHQHWTLLERERAFNSLIWCRSSLTKEKNLPFTKTQHGVKVLVHGHDGQSANSPFSLQNSQLASNAPLKIVNLDNTIRKGSLISDHSPLLAIEN
jgi:hypothetical protein